MKLKSVILCMVMIMSSFTFAAAKPLKVAIVKDVGGVNDQSFNQSAWEGLQKAKKELENVTDDFLTETWTMRNADVIYAVMSKWEVIRHSFNQLIHHRAQLGVYLRLLNIPIPGVYGPSADES